MSVSNKQMEELGALLVLINERYSSGTASESVYFKGVRVELHIRDRKAPDGMILHITSTHGGEVLELVPAVTLEFNADALEGQSVHDTINQARDWLDREVRRFVPRVQLAKAQLLAKKAAAAEQARRSANASVWNRSAATEAAE